MNKQVLRTLLRARFKGTDTRDKESALLCRHVLESEFLKSAQVIGGYVPLPREADVMPIMKAALLQGKTLALPLCEKQPVMTLRKVDSLSDLHPGVFGILEPTPDAPIVPAEEIDLLLVPLEGIDQRGFRLGKGGGYYDHLLAQCDVMSIGCAMSWQWADAVPYDPWDQRLKACADHTGIHYFHH